MGITDIIPLLSSILAFYLSLFMFFKGQKNRVNITFSVFAFIISIWMFGTFMMFINKENIDKIIFWDKFIYCGVVFIPVVMFHFGIAITNNYSKRIKSLLTLGYPLSTFFLLLVPGDLFVHGSFIYEWGAHTKAGLFHHIFLIYFCVYLALWFILVYKYYISGISSFEKEKIKYCFLAFLILAVFGSLGYLPAYGIGIYPFAYFSGILFVVIISYTIIRHRLIDIKLVLRKSTIYLLSLFIILVGATLIKYLSTLIFTIHSIWLDIIILLLGISSYPILKNKFYHIANKYFFTSLYDTQKVITELSDRLRSTLEIEKIYTIIFETLNNSFHFKAFGILSYNPKTKTYNVRYNKNFPINSQKNFPGNDYLYKLFISENKNIITEEARSHFYNKNSKSTLDLLKKLNVEILTPLNIKNKTVGLIVLGQKESGDMYNDEDLLVLNIIGSQAAIAIENATSYKQIADFNIRLKKEVEKATRELKNANEKLKKLDQAKSEFISIASHQLRTPLTIIKGYISMMLEGDFGNLDDIQRENLGKVYDSNERLIQLVENLLNISRIESGRLQFAYEILSLENLVENVVEELRNAANKKRLNFVYKKTSSNLPKTKMDEGKIRQVVMNLIDNAIKYTKKGSVTINLKKTGNYLHFCVSDSGMGINKNDLPNLFKKFSRGESVNVVHTEGTGLGLYVAKQMIEAHKGKIWVESQGPGKGSKFYFELPIIKS